VFSIEPFKEILSRDMKGGVFIAEMLHRTNIFALIGGGENPF